MTVKIVDNCTSVVFENTNARRSNGSSSHGANAPSAGRPNVIADTVIVNVSVVAADMRADEQRRAAAADVATTVSAVPNAVAPAVERPSQLPDANRRRRRRRDMFTAMFKNTNAQITFIDEYVGLNISTYLQFLFIAGEMAGIGLLLSPWPVVTLGWLGFPLLVFVGAVTAYSGNILGKCWAILSERYVQFREMTCPNTYEKIAFMAVGESMSHFANACIQTTLFGGAVVYLMAMAELTEKLFSMYDLDMDFNIWTFVFAISLGPFTYLENPRKYKLVAVGTLFATIFSSCLVLLQLLLDTASQTTDVKHTEFVWKQDQFFLSVGALMFSFGSASLFPTIQNDRFKRYEFTGSLIGSFTVLAIMYMLVVSGSYAVYGDAVNPNALLSLGNSIVSQGALCLMTVHLMFSFVITMTPICLHFEQFFNIAQVFSGKRIALRVFLILGVLFFTRGIRQFSLIVAVIGGITVALTTFILPPLFYIKLCAMKNRNWPSRQIPYTSRVLLCIIVFTGLSVIAMALSSTFYHAMELKYLIEPYLAIFVSTKA